MATTTMSRIDELEENDRRFARQPNGRLKSNFSAGMAQGGEWVRKYDTYLEDMRKDAANWRREGNLPAAERAENQVMWETAERQSTHASKRFHENTNPEEKSRFHERMLESDRDAELAEQRQFQSDKTHDSQWVETRERQQREHQEAQRQAEAQRKAAEDAQKPLRERLQGAELERYHQDRAAFNKGMNALQRGYEPHAQGGKEYLDDPGHDQWFDEQYEVLLKERSKDAAKTGEGADATKAKPASQQLEQTGQAMADMQAKSGQAEPGEQAGKKEGGQTEQAEAQADDGKQHSPLLKQHEGFRAQVADDQKSISYHKGDSQKASFTDLGNRVSLSPDTYKEDPNALKAALRHADEKFERFSINGTREHQEASARLAERMGMGSKVSNADLQDVIAKERELIAKERAEQGQREGGQQAPGAGEQKHAEKPEMVSDSTGQRESDSTRDSTRNSESGTRTPASESGAQSKAAESDAPRSDSAPAAGQSTKAGASENPGGDTQSSTDKLSDELPKPPGYDAVKAARAQGQEDSKPKDGLPTPPGGNGQAEGTGQSDKPASSRLK